jgi:hypothetical protein
MEVLIGGDIQRSGLAGAQSTDAMLRDWWRWCAINEPGSKQASGPYRYRDRLSARRGSTGAGL